jgi:hypothetical protein
MSYFTTWDSIFSEIDHSLKKFSILEDKKEIILDGYKKLRKISGEDFLKKSSNSLVELLSPNFAPWNIIKNANFGRKLWLLKDKENFGDIQKRLLKNYLIHSYGAEAEIEVAGELVQKGFEVEFIRCSNKKDERTPDLKLKICKQQIFLEITTFRTYPKDIPRKYSCDKELRHLRRKLSGKINRRQLQKAPGILVVFTRTPFISDDWEVLIKAVLRILCKHKDISGVVIQHMSIYDDRVNTKEIDRYYSFITYEIDCEGIYTTTNIIALNPAARFPIEKDKIIRLFNQD